MKIVRSLDKPHFHRGLMQPGQVDLEIIRAQMAKFEDMNHNGTIGIGQHPGKRQPVAAIVALAAIDRKRTAGIAVLFQPGQSSSPQPVPSDRWMRSAHAASYTHPRPVFVRLKGFPCRKFTAFSATAMAGVCTGFFLAVTCRTFRLAR